MYVVSKNLVSRVGLLAACVFAAACAVSERPSDNGQSHWLDACESDAECGELSCLCGVCTTSCSEDSECDRRVGRDAVCRSAVLPSCTSERDAPSLCLPPVITVPDDATISTAQPIDAAVDDAPSAVTPPRDSSAPDTSIEPLTNDGGADGGPTAMMDAGLPPNPVEESICEALDDPDDPTVTNFLPEGIERIGSGGGISHLKASGTAFSWLDDSDLLYMADPSAEPEILARDVGRPLHDGDEIIFALWPPVGMPTLAKLSLPNDDVIDLADEAIANITAIAADDSSVYWSSDQGQGDTVTIWRSDREPGNTVMLGTVTGVSPPVMYADDDWLYFPIGLGIDSEDMQLYRLRKDGSEPAEPIGDPMARLYTLFGDANGLFGLVSSSQLNPRSPGADQRVVRIDTADGSVETLYDIQKAWAWTAALDADYVYWIASAGGGATTAALWRGRRDAEGEAVKLAEGWYHGGGFSTVAVSDDWIYFKVDCELGGYVLRMIKPGS